MMFLLNDVVITLENDVLSAASEMAHASAVRLDSVGRMGQELFSEDPLLHRDRLERARRLASLIVCKAPSVNAALFLAPAKRCPVEHVSFRYAQVDFDVMCCLLKRQNEGSLTTVDADRQVWRRLAA